MMNLALWVAQGWLAAVFLGTGVLKLARSKADLERMRGMAYAADRTETEMKLIGLVEVLGGAGLVLPWLLQVVPVLTPVAATGLAVTMVAAALLHVRRGEPAALPAALFVLLVFVAGGRLGLFG